MFKDTAAAGKRGAVENLGVGRVALRPDETFLFLCDMLHAEN